MGATADQYMFCESLRARLQDYVRGTVNYGKIYIYILFVVLTNIYDFITFVLERDDAKALY